MRNQKVKNVEQAVAEFSLTYRKEVKSSVKYLVIYRHRKEYAVTKMCKFFGVSQSGYYGFVSRMDVPSSDLPLAEKIKECQESRYRTYGYRRVQLWFDRNGIHRNPKTVLRVMRKYNLLSCVRHRKYHKYGELLHRYPNLLSRNFLADKPNQKWVTDITYIRTAQGFMFLSVIRDLFDNSIAAYKTSTEQNINLVTSTIIETKKKEKVTAELQLHSDQGFNTLHNSILG